MSTPNRTHMRASVGVFPQGFTDRGSFRPTPHPRRHHSHISTHARASACNDSSIAPIGEPNHGSPVISGRRHIANESRYGSAFPHGVTACCEVVARPVARPDRRSEPSEPTCTTIRQPRYVSNPHVKRGKSNGIENRSEHVSACHRAYSNIRSDGPRGRLIWEMLVSAGHGHKLGVCSSDHRSGTDRSNVCSIRPAVRHATGRHGHTHPRASATVRHAVTGAHGVARGSPVPRARG